MYIQQLYTNCLAEAAYYIESEGEAAIIDPIRETAPYIEMLNSRNANLKYVFETHFHADFVSGHIDLANETGAEIIYGPMADTNYKVHNAKDGEEFSVGKLRIKVLHTPGHTLESSCYLLYDESGKEYCVFTGDTLFVGDVGRPDLLGGVMSKEELAAHMYNSLNTKIKTLADDVIVYPAHGPGSACGKNIGKETWSTIGQQKEMNYYMKETDKDKFIATLCDGITAPPPYFFEDARINKQGYENVDEVVNRNLKPLSVDEFNKEVASGAMILDTRNPDDFEKGFIKGSINIGLNGQYAIWVGTLIHIEQPLVIVCDAGKENESVLRLARVGYECIRGVLDGGIEKWIVAGNPIDTVNSIDGTALCKMVNENNYEVIDVRRIGEYNDGHFKNAHHVALSDLKNNLEEIENDKTYAIHCAGGYRSMIAASIMKQKGYNNIVNVHGGYNKIKECGLEVEEGVAL